MNKEIWKYELQTTGSQAIEMPIGAEILTVQTQNDIPCLWALVHPKESKEMRFIDVYGTGHNVPFGMQEIKKYIGTYQLHGGTLVFHVFERLT